MSVLGKLEAGLRDRRNVRKAPVLHASCGETGFAKASKCILAKFAQPLVVRSWKISFQFSKRFLVRIQLLYLLTAFPHLVPSPQSSRDARAPYRGLQSPVPRFF